MKRPCIPVQIILLILVGCVAIAPAWSANPQPLADMRSFDPRLDGRWIGNGISYGPYRDGEHPDSGVLTSKEHLLEDLRLLAPRWQLIRVYGAGPQAQSILEVIEEHDLPIRVMQGAWISSHQSQDENEAEVQSAIDLANRFGDIVVAVNIGNEIFVDWSAHRIDDMDTVIGYLRRVRASIRQPVTVNDDYNFWNKPPAKRIAAEVDFIGLHAYAFWNNQTLDDAMDWTRAIYADISSRYPGYVVALCESGWPTSRVIGDGSYEGGLVGVAGEDEQRRFFEEYDAWINENGIVSFYFEAFDEQWKGGFDGDNPMDKAEKHWGLYFSNRKPKAALR